MKCVVAGTFWLAITVGQVGNLSGQVTNLSYVTDTDPSRQIAQAPPPAAPAEQTKPKTPAEIARMSVAELEPAVWSFVDAHHPELRKLLQRLKQHQPDQFERAMRELFRTRERLRPIQRRDPERYELELQLWKAQSRAQVLAARLTMADDPVRWEQLEKLVAETVEIRLRIMERERQRQAERLQKLDQQIQKLQAEKQSAIDREIKTLTSGRRSKP